MICLFTKYMWHRYLRWWPLNHYHGHGTRFNDGWNQGGQTDHLCVISSPMTRLKIFAFVHLCYTAGLLCWYKRASKLKSGSHWDSGVYPVLSGLKKKTLQCSFTLAQASRGLSSAETRGTKQFAQHAAYTANDATFNIPQVMLIMAFGCFHVHTETQRNRTLWNL